MEQNEFVPHPLSINYEASRAGVIRHCRLKTPVGNIDNAGYFRFTAGGKRYLSHRFAYECHFGLIENGFVINHIDGDIQNNQLSNLEVVTQSENCKAGNTGISPKTPKSVKSVNTDTGEELVFNSMNAAAKYFGICMPSVKRVADKIYKSTFSIKYNQWIVFECQLTLYS